MKKILNFSRIGLVSAIIIFSSFFGTAQSININVKGVEYDDADFSLLKESIQKSKSVNSLKSSYEEGIAKITFYYARKAQELWDELPQTTKHFFKVISINDNVIILESKLVGNANNQVKSNTVSVVKDNDCQNCYYNLCKYDGTRSFQGVIYKAINFDEGTFYFNCDNGIVTRKLISVNGYGQVMVQKNDTILMSNAPIGTSWGTYSNGSNFLGLKNSFHSKYTLVAKGLTKTVNGKTYKDVIVVNFYSRSIDNVIEGTDTKYSENYYYAEGVGLIERVIVDPNIEPLSTVHISNRPVELPNIPEIKGIIDPGLVGTWVDKHDPSGFSYTYKFYSDGLFEYYVGSTLSYNGSKCLWRLDGNYINFFCTGWPNVYRQQFQRKNDTSTGKRAIVIQFKGTEYRTYLFEN